VPSIKAKIGPPGDAARVRKSEADDMAEKRPIASSTYYESVAKRLHGDRLSIRDRSDISLKIKIRNVLEQNFRVYGVRKV